VTVFSKEHFSTHKWAQDTT